MPEKLFYEMIFYLSEDKQNYYIKNIFSKSANWGARKGGIVTFSKYPEIFRKSRKIVSKIKKQYINEEFFTLLKLNKNICEFIGAVIGDGCLDGYLDARNNSKYHIFITGDAILDNNYLTKVLPAKLNEFNLSPYIYYRKDCNAMILNFFSKKLFYFFTNRLDFVPGNKTFSVRIPDEIMQSDPELVFATIRGVFDTDGTIFFDKRKSYVKPYPRIALQTVSKPLFLQLKNFLQNYFSLYIFENSKRNAYHIEIYGHAQLNKWMKLIGFSNNRHLDKINRYYKLVAGVEPAISAS